MRSLFVKKYTLSFCIAQKSLLCKRFFTYGKNDYIRNSDSYLS